MKEMFMALFWMVGAMLSYGADAADARDTRCYYQVCEMLPDNSTFVCGTPKQGTVRDAQLEIPKLPGRGHIFNVECTTTDNPPVLKWQNVGPYFPPSGTK